MFQIMNSNEYVGDEGAREVEAVAATAPESNSGIGFAGLAAVATSSALGGLAAIYAARGIDKAVDWATEKSDKPAEVNVNVTPAATPAPTAQAPAAQAPAPAPAAAPATPTA